MAKREYSGPPLDGTEQYITEANGSGETIAGTSEDDNGDENTEAWPSALDKGDFSPTETEVIKRLCVHPNSSYSAVADAVGCSDTVVYNARQKIKEQGKEDSIPFEVERDPKQAGKERGGEQNDESESEPTKTGSVKEWFIETISSHPNESVGEIADRIPNDKDWSEQNYYNVMRKGRGRAELKRRIVQKSNWDRTTGKIREKLEDVEIDVEPETESDTEQETTEENTLDKADQEDTADASSRVSELEETVAGLTQALVSDHSNGELASEIVSEMDAEAIADSAIEVVVNE